MTARHRKTLAAIFTKPTLASIVFADIEALIKALGGTVSERAGSHVKIERRASNGAAIGLIRARRRSDIRWKKLESSSSVQE